MLRWDLGTPVPGERDDRGTGRPGETPHTAARVTAAGREALSSLMPLILGKVATGNSFALKTPCPLLGRSHGEQRAGLNPAPAGRGLGGAAESPPPPAPLGGLRDLSVPTNPWITTEGNGDVPLGFIPGRCLAGRSRPVCAIKQRFPGEGGDQGSYLRAPGSGKSQRRAQSAHSSRSPCQ